MRIPGPAARGRVLVVDDDACVLRAIRRVLAGAHEVVTVQDGPAVLAVLERERAFDAMICDVELFGMDVAKLWGQLALRHPAIAAHVVFLSAGVLTGAHEAFLVETGRPLLDKPFDVDELRRTVARVVVARRMWPGPGLRVVGRDPSAIPWPLGREDAEGRDDNSVVRRD